MRQLVLIATFAMAIAVNAIAQGRGGAAPIGTVTGVVVDSATTEPMPVATVAIHRAKDSVLVTGALTARNGTFAISGIGPGLYYARISYIGYSPCIVDGITVTPGSATALPPIAIAQSTVQSGEVSITAQRDFMTVEIDRTVYKAADMPVAAGGSATDVLRNIPSIEVDIDGNISMRGNQNVVVLLNGRALSMNGDALTSFLQNLPANSIDRIEVIPNPSAKYDPEGMSGIVNIVLKEQQGRGLSGGVNAGAGTLDTYSAGANVSYGSGAWNLYGNYGFNAGRREFTGTRSQRNYVASLTPQLEQISADRSRWRGHVVNGSIEHLLDPRNSIAINAVVNRRDNVSGGTTHSSGLDQIGETLERYDRTSAVESGGTNMDYRLSYKWVAEPSKHEISVESRYASGADNASTGYTQQYFESASSDSIDRQNVVRSDDNRTVALQVDYVRPVSDGGRLEAGYKGELETIAGDFVSESLDRTTASFVPDTALNNAYTYDRQIHAMYAIYAQDLGVFGVQVGARIEKALTTFDQKTTGVVVDNDYFSVFPSAHITYKPVDALNFKASYSRRINRPWISILNPFVSQDDPTFREAGNPNIKPEYTDALELSVNHFTDLTTITLTPYYRRTTDVIRRYGDLDTVTGVGTVTFRNFDISTSYGADFTGSVRLGDRFNAFTSFGVYQMATDASNVEEGLKSDAFGWNARINATVGLLDGMDMQVTWFYRSPWALEGGGQVGAFQMTDVALTQRLLENRLRIGLRVSDLFDQRGFRITRNDPQFDLTFSRKPTSRTAMLTASYSFGTPDRSPRRRLTTPNPQENEGGGGW